MIVAVVVVYHYTTITDSVPHPSGDGALELLKDMDGYAKPGTMTALMGSSGAGK
jgi:ABC-type multidrug transport system ATPase subunit